MTSLKKNVMQGMSIHIYLLHYTYAYMYNVSKSTFITILTHWLVF